MCRFQPKGLKEIVIGAPVLYPSYDTPTVGGAGIIRGRYHTDYDNRFGRTTPFIGEGHEDGWNIHLDDEDLTVLFK